MTYRAGHRSPNTHSKVDARRPNAVRMVSMAVAMTFSTSRRFRLPLALDFDDRLTVQKMRFYKAADTDWQFGKAAATRSAAVRITAISMAGLRRGTVLYQHRRTHSTVISAMPFPVPLICGIGRSDRRLGCGVDSVVGFPGKEGRGWPCRYRRWIYAFRQSTTVFQTTAYGLGWPGLVAYAGFVEAFKGFPLIDRKANGSPSFIALPPRVCRVD